MASLNQGLDESNWKITCIRLAPNAPQQNQIEDIWLQAKRFIRECYHLCKSFGAVQYLLFGSRGNITFPPLPVSIWEVLLLAEKGRISLQLDVTIADRSSLLDWVGAT